MDEFGVNPRYGRHPGVLRANHLFGDPFGYSYGWVPPLDGLFAPPPGYAWFDQGPINAMPIQPWGLPGGGVPGAIPDISQTWHWQSPYGIDCGMSSPGLAENGGIPGINFQNSHGGVGIEPGYNYIFPQQHCKIHVLVSEDPPWEGGNDGSYEKRCFNVPTGITVKELMQQFGCTNEDAKKNVLYELSQGGDGRWYRGLTIKGDNKDMIKKTIADVGWNNKRNGIDEDFVWLYFTKD